MARPSIASTLSASIGFSRKYVAPALMASTARGMLPCPLMTRTSVRGCSVLKRRTRSAPLTSGSTRSTSAASGCQLVNSGSASAPRVATRTSYPAPVTVSASHSAMSGSSSMTSTRLIRLPLMSQVSAPPRPFS